MAPPSGREHVDGLGSRSYCPKSLKVGNEQMFPSNAWDIMGVLSVVVVLSWLT